MATILAASGEVGHKEIGITRVVVGQLCSEPAMTVVSDCSSRLGMAEMLR